MKKADPSSTQAGQTDDANAKRPFFRWGNPILWGIVATVVVTLGGAWLAILPTCNEGVFGPYDCEPKYLAFLGASPNEVGDTLAGFAGAFAFIWLIATVWLQSQELAEQRREIQAQREATEGMAVAQGDQVELLRAQGDIFLDEQRQRDEDRARRLAEELLKGLVVDLRDASAVAHWARELQPDPRLRNQKKAFHHIRLTGDDFDWSADPSQIIRETAKNVEKLIPSFRDMSKIKNRSHMPAEFPKIQEKIRRIEVLKQRLSDDQKEYISNAHIDLLSEKLTELLSLDVWIEDPQK
ncbi:MAG: hypothetical protein KDK53_04585 [Maritimibacter sp.]|nr:hypothetical protein [Maritimibacter sp.]